MGRVKGVGVDCAMLPAGIYAACGLIPPQSVDFYPMDWHMHRSAERYLERVLAYAHEVETPEPGDMALWRFGRAFAHGAIITAWPRIVHAVNGLGVVEDEGDNAALLTLRSGQSRERRFYSLWGAQT
jgi:hypothetical protein